jgi:hypothetical protein
MCYSSEIAKPRRSMSDRQGVAGEGEFFIWIRRNPLKSPDSDE